MSVSLIIIPQAKSFYGLIAPNICLGFGLGTISASMMPAMAFLVDLRYSSVYGNIYALADSAFCISFTVGPALSGFAVRLVGFPWMLRILAIISLSYAPLLLLLRSPPVRNEKTSLITNKNYE
ncbi:unnamed protein product [Didymodactylos carnosus]|uniref:Uncharacterized protein n=1 Tax=Didymodactylos carnosus TaxID=1234261 RepID=A0A8S2D9E2_9BILA|nr:unnamed protein product [Didymodactylos carnosus]CAF3654428.1 unnamed protein product [Didymodactylos carnosus]